MPQLAYTFVGNTVAQARRVVQQGREWLVAPAVSIIGDGVLPGSQGPLLYPSSECARNVSAWNQVPLVAYHPTDELGNPCAASHPGVLSRQGIGHVKNSVFDGRLRHVFWVDVNRARAVDPYTNGAGTKIINALERGQPVEISTGLYTHNIPRHGTTRNGRGYTAIATRYQPDHIAILPDQRGACSVADGCGLLVNASARGNYVVNPFVSRQQQKACYAKRDRGEAGSWDCDEWSEATKKAGKKLPRHKKQTHNVAGPKDGCGDGG